MVMATSDLQETIEAAYEDRNSISPETSGPVREAIDTALDGLDSGTLRVAEKSGHGWIVNQWLKMAVLLSFRLYDMAPIAGGPGGNTPWFDKVSSKFADWDEARFRDAGFRAVPNCVVRRSAHIAPGVILMPCFVNLGRLCRLGDDGGHLGDRRQLRAGWQELSYLGGCRYRWCIGTVTGQPCNHRGQLLHRSPFGGRRRCDRRRRAVLSMGVYIGASTRIVDRDSGEVVYGRVPAYSVVVPGSMPGRSLADGSPGPSLYCAVIVKRVDAGTREKTSINELLRD